MIIHIVGQGETVDSIAQKYSKPVDRFALENGINISDSLAVGEALVVVYPEIEYTVQPGDTLVSIASAHNTSLMEILRNNPYLSDRKFIYPGEIIVIKYEGEKTSSISTNGYVYPFVNLDILKKTLPFLTMLSIYSHYYDENGDILFVNDSEIIQMAIAYGVAPVMVLAEIADGDQAGRGVTHNILINPVAQDNLINNLILILNRSGYYGVNLISPYVLPEDRPLFVEFIDKLSTRLHLAGYKINLSLTLNVFEVMTNVLYEDLQYDKLGQLADNVILMSYEAGFTLGVSQGIIAFETIDNILNYAVSMVSSDKIFYGFSTVGYFWELPILSGATRGQAIRYNAAIDIAREFNAAIKFDDVTKISYFQYAIDSEYVVRFKDARGIDAFAGLVPRHNIRGVGLWNVMYFFTQMWLVINTQYEIERIVPLRIQD
ncbi:MAG: LysM peptidoglycan-binding domain-containing protein [Clostridiales bacterium]|nr:LysM peptidoglycan-binding domain-containing protein [Clostridiales bacterium]